MYAGKVGETLKKMGIEAGERISVEKNSKRYEGLLMPRIETGDRSCLVLKLDSGYNIGIDCRGAKIKRSATKEPASIREEATKEMGRGAGGSHKKGGKGGRPLISVLATGGTITSKIDYKTGGVTSLTDPEELMQRVPGLSSIASISISSPFTIMSESMTHEHWQKLAVETAKDLRKSEGVILTHGTDTLHYTSAALSFMLRGLTKPVILTGSQRSTDRGSSDGNMNLICSARAALSDMAAVGICMHGTMHDDYCILSRGTKVRKMHTSRRDSFRPVNDIPLARVWPDGKIEKLQDIPPRGKGHPKTDTAFEPRVALLKTYPGASPDIIDYHVRRGYRGLVLEVTGLGQAPTYGKATWLDSIRKATDKGVVVCGAAETLYGRLNPNVYTEGRLTREAGVVHLEDMLPETAYVKLGWVLGHTKSPEKAKEMMLQNYAGEISERSTVEGFLY